MFDTFIAEANNDRKAIQDICETQRTTRNERFKHQLLGPDFKGVRRDEILIKLLNDPAHVDARNNLCVWARPTKIVASLITEIQTELAALAPVLWTPPPSNLHMTVLEIMHSATPEAVTSCAKKLQPCLKRMVNLPLEHRCRLIKPRLTFDDVAVALTFVPAARERRDDVADDAFTYIHLRAELSKICCENGVEVAARYATTSSHMTVARFITDRDHRDKGAMEAWISKIEELNIWLEEKYWPKNGDNTCFEWYVGAERGLEIRGWKLWYGGGETIETGDHF